MFLHFVPELFSGSEGQGSEQVQHAPGKWHVGTPLCPLDHILHSCLSPTFVATL